MSRRTVAGLLALGLAAVLVVFAAREPVPYVTFKPGPTVNVLGEYNGEKVIKISGRQVYEDDGALRLLTVYTTGPKQKLDLLTIFSGWVSSDVAVIPRDAVYKDGDTDQKVKQQSALQMSTSQDAATAAGLTAAGIKYSFGGPIISLVSTEGASNGLLELGDSIVKVNGKAVGTPDAVVAEIEKLKPGAKVTFTVRRTESETATATPSPTGPEPTARPKTTVKDIVITTRPDPEDPKKARAGINVGAKFVFPFDVDINLGNSIGGPSAGMMFALSIYDLLTPGSLTGGKSVAGTGEITADGIVGPIGGIGQKMVGAQRDGAQLFLVPRENWSEAIASPYDKDQMKLACVHTIPEALKAITTWRENQNATLAGCSS